jgi:hypothetical protein
LVGIGTSYTTVISFTPSTNTTYLATGFITVNNNGSGAVDQVITAQFTAGAGGILSMVVPAGQSGNLVMSSLYTSQTVGTPCTIALEAKKSAAVGGCNVYAQANYLGIN